MSQVAAHQALDLAMRRSSVGHAWLCDRACVHRPGIAQDIRFDPPRALPELLTGPVVQALQVELGAAVAQRKAAHCPGFFLDEPEVVLQGLTIEVADDRLHAEVRLPDVTGEVMALFRAEMRGEARPVPGVDGLARQTLEDLIDPALSLYDHIVTNGLSDLNSAVLLARLKTMSAQREQLGGYAELLSHFADRPAPEAAAHRGGSETRRDRPVVSHEFARRTARAGETTVLFGHQRDLLAR